METRYSKVLVSDFDGTMTRHDFYKLAIERLIPADCPDHWVDYRAGKTTHFEALRRYFEAIVAPESDVLDVVKQMELDPKLPTAVAKLRSAGWDVVVTSAGCQWYIDRLLGEAGVDVEVHANPGRYEAGRGLMMSMPVASPFRSETIGIHKAAVVQHYLDRGCAVAFAGDGFPDADAARLVSDELRFARGDLESVLRDEHLPFHPFAQWSDIAGALLTR